MEGPVTRSWAWLIAVVVIAVDLAVYPFLPPDHQYAIRLLAAVAIVYLLVVARVTPPEAMGFGTGRVVPEVRFALKVGVIVCVVLAAVGLVALAVVRLTGLRPPLPTSTFDSSADFFEFLLHACVMAPVVEEFIYRGLFVGLTLPAWGKRATIGVSALLFVVLHVIYRTATNPVAMAEYAVAGGLLAWVFATRRSLIACVVLHALGNLTVATQNFVLLKWPDLPHRLLGY